jgi:hypothetical protein
MFNPPINLVNQLIVVCLSIFGGLYVYRSIESRIVMLETRVGALERGARFVTGA